MDKSAKDKIPAVLGLLMGLVGMTAMTLMGYYTAPEDGFSPRDIAVRASIAWGVMLVLGYIVGIYAKQFVPDLVKKNAATIKTDEESGSGEEASGPKKIGEGATKATVGAGAAEGGGLNILLDETPQMTPGGDAAAMPAGGQAAIPAPPSGVSIPAPQG